MDFYQQIIALCKEKGISLSEMTSDVGISRSAPKNWTKNGITPDREAVKKIADYFGVPISYFSIETDDESQNSEPNTDEYKNMSESARAIEAMKILRGRALSKEEEEIVKIFMSLDHEHRKELHDRVKDLAKKTKGEDTSKNKKRRARGFIVFIKLDP